MSPAQGLTGVLIAALVAVSLAACDKLPGQGPKLPFDKDRLEAALDPTVGGPDTCVVLKDVASGKELYRYGAESACNRPLAPCATFQAPMTVIGLSDGKVTPGETWKWDGKTQPYKLWEHDQDMASAWRSGAGWWFQKLATDIGPERFKAALKSFDYGQPVGRPDAFWMGPAAGGGLFVSTRTQADFMRDLARGKLDAKPDAQAQVMELMTDTTRGQTKLYDLGASCPSIADSSRDVSWWLARLQSPFSDYILALSIESNRPLSGLEIRNRMLPILSANGLLPVG